MSIFELRYLIALSSQEAGYLVYSMIGAQFAVYVGIYWMRRGGAVLPPVLKHGCMLLYTLFISITAFRTMQVFNEISADVSALVAKRINQPLGTVIDDTFSTAFYIPAFSVIYALFWLSTLYLMYVHDFSEQPAEDNTTTPAAGDDT